MSSSNIESSTVSNITTNTQRQPQVGVRAKRLDDDFRVGSYVVHTPPARYNTEAPASPLVACNHNVSQIPGYQFKTKIATLGPYQSPPLSPKRKRSLSKPDILSPVRNGLSHFESKREDPEAGLGLSPRLLPQQPKAIPRSVAGLKQQQQNHHQQQQLEIDQSGQEPGFNMGDRLSSPVVASPGERHFISNRSRAISGKSASGWLESDDSWKATPSQQQHSTGSKYLFSQRGQIKKQMEQAQQQQQREMNCIGSNKQTPRLPRGVSRIPHQVYANEKNSTNGYQQKESIDKDTSISDSSRYLTFSKDQATSHFKSLREELSVRRFEEQNHHQHQQEHQQHIQSPVAISRPSPQERQSKTRTPAIVPFAINSNETQESNINTQLRQQQQQQQQPICEAFIMTGQSMLKLSCNESENNKGNSINNSNGNNSDSNASREVDSRIKSLSLNKLNNNNNNNTTRANHLKSTEDFGRTLENVSSIDQPSDETHTGAITKLKGNDDTGIVTSSTTISSTLVHKHQAKSIEPLSKRVDPTDNRCLIVNSARGQNSNNNNKRNDNTAGSASHVSVSSTVESSESSQNDHQAANVAGAAAEPDAKLERIVPVREFDERNSRESCTNFLNSKSNIIDTISKNETLITSGKLDASNKILPTAGDNGCHNAATEDEPDKAIKLSSTDCQEPVQTGEESPKLIEKFSHDLTSQAINRPSTPTNTDRDSAKRLAKRLYTLSGFKKADVCHHLAKRNPFSNLVAEEYLNLFDFRSTKLDSALRKFLAKLQLNGETQERERVLSVFSQRYYNCNKEKFPSSGIVQTLVCALILLNTDLHGGHSKKKQAKLSLGAFVDGLNNSLAATGARPGDNLTGSVGACLNGADLNYTFPRHLLVDLYESIRKRPLKYSEDKCDISSFEAELDKMYAQQVGNRNNRSNTLPTRRFAPGSNAPSSTMSASSRRLLKQGLNKLNSQDESEAAIEFKSGYLNRKRIFEANGSATTKGRRSWRKVYVILQDLRLIMRFGLQDDSKQQQQNDNLTAKQQAKYRAQIVAQDMKNTIKIHHAFAKRSTSYTKRDFVFHLRFADESEILLEAYCEEDACSWIDTINFAAACLSSPALPSAVSTSNGKTILHKTRKPVLPVAYTKLSYWEQLIDHEERLQRLKLELDEHLSEAPNTKNANKRYKTEFIEKIAYLKQEIERYTVYVDLMRKRSNSPEAIILSKHPQIASLVPSKEMILSLPSFAPPKTVESLTET